MQDPLSQYQAKTTLTDDLHLPTRNDPFNMLLTGGWLFGAVNEVHGPAGIGKTTICAESIADCQHHFKRSWQLIFDREGRLKKPRLESVGVDLEHPGLVYVPNDPVQLSVEYVFDTASKMVYTIRAKDLQRVIDMLDPPKPAKGKKPKPDKNVVARYRGRLGSPGLTGPQLAKALTGTIKNKKVTKPNLLCPEDRSFIWIVLDSTTAMPSTTELVGTKPASKDVDLLECLARQNVDSSNALGQRARSWSDFFRTATFLDSHCGMLATSQMRTKGIGSGMVWEDAAQPVANDFYARTRVKLIGMSGKNGGIFFNATTGGLEFNIDKVPIGNRTNVVGRRLLLDVKKTSGAVLGTFKCPHVYMTGTGTDRANTIWEFLVYNSLLTHVSSGRWALADGSGRVPPITRANFVKTGYVEHLEVWSSVIKDFINKLKVAGNAEV